MKDSTNTLQREDRRSSTVVISGADASDYSAANAELRNASRGGIVLRDTTPARGPEGYERRHLLPWIRRADIVHIDLWPFHLSVEDLANLDIETEVLFGTRDEPWRWALYIATTPQFLPNWLAIVTHHNRDAAVTVIRGKGDRRIVTEGNFKARLDAGFPERSELDFPERRA